MNTPQIHAKSGPKPKHYIASDGTPIVGLTRRPDGRWRLLGSHKTFREPDEKKAIVRFKELKGLEVPESVRDLVEFAKGKGTSSMQEIQRGVIILNEEWFYRWLAGEIATKPQLWAERLGIEQIGYLRNLKPPEPPATVKEVRDLWEKHASKNTEKSKVLAAWDDFVEATEIKVIPDITPEIRVEFEDEIKLREIAPKTQQHLYSRIRRMLAFARKRVFHVSEMILALKHLEDLNPSESGETLDPQPIKVDDWKKLYKASSGDDKAMLLMMLNCGLYLQEIADLEWDDIKEGKYLVKHRNKRGQCLRVAVLWDETIEALSKIKHHPTNPSIFIGIHGVSLTVSGAGKRFRAIRKAAKVSAEVTAAHLRDGAATAASEAGIEGRLCNSLMGHRNGGMWDKYAKRVPASVKPATDAIHKHYFG